MDVHLTLKEGGRFMVVLSIDLTPYCDAYQFVLAARTNLSSLYKSSPEALDLEAIAEAKKEVQKRTNAFFLLRNDYLNKLRYVQGDLHWLKIKELFKSQCVLTCPVEQQIYSALSASSTDLDVSLVVKSLDFSFIELLKNSIDALLIGYFRNSSRQTVLQMAVALAFNSENLSIGIVDNAGGFASDYLDYFSDTIRLIKTRETAPMKWRTKGAFREYCFGGAGRSHLALANFLLKGELLTDTDTFSSLYKVHEGATLLSLKNSGSNSGAEIILRSPIAPCMVSIGKIEDEDSSKSTMNLVLPRTDDAPKLVDPERARSLFKAKFALLLFPAVDDVEHSLGLTGRKRRVPGDERGAGLAPNPARRRVG